MRRVLTLLACLALVATAHAQTTSPAVTSLARPLRLTTTLERAADHGCSQSFESVSATAHVTLAIDSSGATRLTLDGTFLDNMGPSPGRYMAGDHDFTRLTELHRSTWSGSATVLPDGIAIRFDHVEAAEARFTGWGTLPLPPATSALFAAEFHCAIARTDVLPAVESAPERATTLPLLSCAWTGSVPSPFDRYAIASFVLGAGPGVRDIASESMFSAGPGHSVRLVP